MFHSAFVGEISWGPIKIILFSFKKKIQNVFLKIQIVCPPSGVEAQQLNTWLKEIEKLNIFFDTSLVLESFSVATKRRSEITDNFFLKC